MPLRATTSRRSTAMRRGLRFLEDFAPSDPCWSACAPDVEYMFFHLATRSREPVLARRARAAAERAARRWCAENPGVPDDASAGDVLWWYAYGAYTPTALGHDTRAVRRELARAVRRHSTKDLLGADPRRQAPPAHEHRRYEAWQATLVGAHLAEELGLDIRCSVRDAISWRPAMLPYPEARRRLTWAAWYAFYAATHLVYVLNDYSRHTLPRRRLQPEVDFLQQVCRHGIADGDVEILGESLDVLLALGEPESSPLVEAARARILAIQNADGSWGLRSDVPYTRFHKTWVALDGLADYGRRSALRPRLRT